VCVSGNLGIILQVYDSVIWPHYIQFLSKILVTDHSNPGCTYKVGDFVREKYENLLGINLVENSLNPIVVIESRIPQAIPVVFVWSVVTGADYDTIGRSLRIHPRQFIHHLCEINYVLLSAVRTMEGKTLRIVMRCIFRYWKDTPIYGDFGLF